MGTIYHQSETCVKNRTNQNTAGTSFHLSETFVRPHWPIRKAQGTKPYWYVSDSSRQTYLPSAKGTLGLPPAHRNARSAILMPAWLALNCDKYVRSYQPYRKLVQQCVHPHVVRVSYISFRYIAEASPVPYPSSPGCSFGVADGVDRCLSYDAFSPSSASFAT